MELFFPFHFGWFGNQKLRKACKQFNFAWMWIKFWVTVSDFFLTPCQLPYPNPTQFFSFPIPRPSSATEPLILLERGRFRLQLWKHEKVIDATNDLK